MDWIFYALTAAVIWGVTSLAAKKILDNTAAVIHAAAVAYSITIAYTVYFVLSGQVFSVGGGFWIRTALGVSILGNIAGFLVFNYAVKNGEVSAVLPIRRLTPILTAFVAALTIGEQLEPSSGLGVLLATAGALMVVGKPGKIIRRRPEITLKKNTMLAALGAALLYAFTSTADRVATQTIDPKVYTLLINSAMAVGYTLIIYFKPGRDLGQLKSKMSEYSEYYFLWGIAGAVASLSIFTAFSMAKAALVTTVQQLQAVIPVVGGYLLFGDGNLLRKLGGSALIVLGIALTLL